MILDISTKTVNIGTYTYSETFDKLDALFHISPPSSTSNLVGVRPMSTKEEQTDMNNKKVYMYCTGGVRCEKASAYLRNRGFENVYHVCWKFAVYFISYRLFNKVISLFYSYKEEFIVICNLIQTEENLRVKTSCSTVA